MTTQRAILLGATLCQLALSVTLDSSDPTDDSNYSLMQGDFVYVSGAQNLGTIAARAQMLRSALTASTHVSVAMKIKAAPAGTRLDFTLRRSKCDVPSVQVYQDPYQCPNYNPILDSNDCTSQPADSAVPIEMTMTCTVDSAGACNAKFDWAIYLPEEYQGQKLSEFSIGAASGGEDVACANLGASRDTLIGAVVNRADSSGSTGQIALGGLQKDELGYTHASFVAFSLTPTFTYGARVEDGPCDAAFSNLPVAGLAATFTTSASGVSNDVSFFTDSIVGPEAQSLVVTDCLGSNNGPDASGVCAGGAPVIICYDLDLVSLEARKGAEEAASTATCDAWANLYSGKKSKHGKSFKFGDFEDKTVNGDTRCCMSTQFEHVHSKKASDRTPKSSALMSAGFRNEDSGNALAGLGAGVAGAIVLAAGFVLHIRRVRSQLVKIEISESTPLQPRD